MTEAPKRGRKPRAKAVLEGAEDVSLVEMVDLTKATMTTHNELMATLEKADKAARHAATYARGNTSLEAKAARHAAEFRAELASPTFTGTITHPDPVPGDNGKALARIVAFFKATHPDEWEKMRLTPLQHGLDDMVALL